MSPASPTEAGDGGDPVASGDRRHPSGSVRSTMVVLAVILGSGVGAAACAGAPTDSSAIDRVLAFAVGAFVAWAAATSPWWALGAAALLTGAFGAFTWFTLASVLALGVAAWCRLSGDQAPPLRAAAGGLIVLNAFTLTVDVFLGASAIVAGVVLLGVTLAGVLARPRPQRTVALATISAVGVLGVLACAGMGAGALQARDHLEEGNRQLTDGFDRLRDGDTDAAQASLAEAAENLDAAADALDSPLTAPARLVPVVAQHRALAGHIASTAADAARAASSALAAADIDQLRLVDGELDVDALALLAGPFAELDRAVARLDTVFTEAFAPDASPWLIGPVRRELAKAQPDIEVAATQTAAIAAVASRGPAMLGSEGERRYLVAFTTPGVARAQGGAVAAVAEITVRDGRIEHSVPTRSEDIVEQLRGPAGAAAGADPAEWDRATSDPDTPTVARTLARLYAAAGNADVDGVIVIDPVGLGGLLDVAGPTDITFGQPPNQTTERVDGARLTDFLLRDQYALAPEIRSLVVGAAAGAALERFLGAELPDPQDFGAALGGPATEQHISWWSSRPEEQATIELIGISGRLPSPDGGDGLAIVSDDPGTRPLDAYLSRTVRYTAVNDPGSGDVDGELTVALRNDAPATGDETVIGNDLGLPLGTNRTTLSIYSPLDVQAVTIDGDPVTGSRIDREGWNITTLVIDVPPGGTKTVRASVSGEVTGDYRLTWRAQPMTTEDSVELSVTRPDGTVVAEHAGALPRTSIVDATGIRGVH